MLQKFDVRNEHLMVWVGNGLMPRKEAKVSVFDSVVQGGDAVWEGLRKYERGIFLLDRHLARLQASAKALAFADIPELTFVKKAISATLEANSMDKDVHIRLTLTRGEKITSGMDPRLNQSGSTLIVLAEWKPPVYDNKTGIRLITSSQRRNNPSFLDSKIHHNNLLNNILAKIQANVAGADAALMLDFSGFVAELNGTNLFMTKDGIVHTPTADACLHGITRGMIIQLCRENQIPVVERNISLTEVYDADEVFCTGTMGELTPIVEVDGRPVGRDNEFGLFHKVKNAFSESIPMYCVPV